jgi:hypothetical protein
MPYSDCPGCAAANRSDEPYSPLNSMDVFAFFCERSMEPRKELSMRRNATRRPDGSTTAMLSAILLAVAFATAAEMTVCASLAEMKVRCRVAVTDAMAKGRSARRVAKRMLRDAMVVGRRKECGVVLFDAFKKGKQEQLHRRGVYIVYIPTYHPATRSGC